MPNKIKDQQILSPLFIKQIFAVIWYLLHLNDSFKAMKSIRKVHVYWNCRSDKTSLQIMITSIRNLSYAYYHFRTGLFIKDVGNALLRHQCRTTFALH